MRDFKIKKRTVYGRNYSWSIHSLCPVNITAGGRALSNVQTMYKHFSRHDLGNSEC